MSTSVSQRFPVKVIATQILIAPVLLWLVWSADIWTAVSLIFPAYFIIALISVGLLLLPGILVRKPTVVVVPGIWLAFLFALPFLNNSSLKPLLRGVDALKVGMGRDEVFQTLTNPYAGTDYPLPLVHSEQASNSNSEAGETMRICIKPQGRPPELQAECLLVFLKNGRFRNAEFSAD